VPLGDGGGGGDQGRGHTDGIGNAQDRSNWHGSILRIDVDNGDPYGIPADNPFVDDDLAAAEIYAYGFRNPWRISFDPEYGLVTADLGQHNWEEVNLVQAGGNYGWRIKEATACFNPEDQHNPLPECPEVGPYGEPLLDPVLQYDHLTGIATIGGAIYRGSLLPAYEGRYFFGDWNPDGAAEPNGTVFVASPADDGWTMEEVYLNGTEDGRLDAYLLSIEAVNDEIYLLSSRTLGPTGDTGAVWRLVPSPA
jgi:glucose/arabinose dehydrogenase